METHTKKFKVRLGLFVAGGIALFVITIFIIGKQKNLFNPVFRLTSAFYNVSGLQVGNNIRFSGINVGTVDNISIINDSTVKVDLLIRKEVKKFIKSRFPDLEGKSDDTEYAENQSNIEFFDYFQVRQ